MNRSRDLLNAIARVQDNFAEFKIIAAVRIRTPI
jgi:hypothetical protein